MSSYSPCSLLINQPTCYRVFRYLSLIVFVSQTSKHIFNSLSILFYNEKAMSRFLYNDVSILFYNGIKDILSRLLYNDVRDKVDMLLEIWQDYKISEECSTAREQNILLSFVCGEYKLLSCFIQWKHGQRFGRGLFDYVLSFSVQINVKDVYCLGGLYIFAFGKYIENSSIFSYGETNLVNFLPVSFWWTCKVCKLQLKWTIFTHQLASLSFSR